MIRLRVKPNSNGCTHAETISVRSAGVERTVCENCGHISFRFLPKPYGHIDRSRFAEVIEHPEE